MPKIEEKGVDIKAWIFNIFQAMVGIFLTYYLNTSNVTQKEILMTLAALREQIAVEKKEKEYMQKNDSEQDATLKEMNKEVQDLKHRVGKLEK